MSNTGVESRCIVTIFDMTSLTVSSHRQIEDKHRILHDAANAPVGRGEVGSRDHEATPRPCPGGAATRSCGRRAVHVICIIKQEHQFAVHAIDQPVHRWEAESDVGHTLEILAERITLRGQLCMHHELELGPGRCKMRQQPVKIPDEAGQQTRSQPVFWTDQLTERYRVDGRKPGDVSLEHATSRIEAIMTASLTVSESRWTGANG